MVLLCGCVTGGAGRHTGSADSPVPGRSERHVKGGDVECTSNIDCSASQKCIRPRSSAFPNGVCGDAVDQTGMPIHDVGAEQEAGSCTFDMDCPTFFSCHKLNAIEGVCVRR
jgi:hypothetical protein